MIQILSDTALTLKHYESFMADKADQGKQVSIISFREPSSAHYQYERMSILCLYNKFNGHFQSIIIDRSQPNLHRL